MIIFKALKLFIYFDKPKCILKKTPDKNMLESSREDWLKPNKDTKPKPTTSRKET
jgi:hypothetical protein